MRGLPNFKQPVKNQKGVALMMALFCVMIIIYLASEMTYETNVEYLVNSQSVNRIKAHYAALAGVEISLLRIKIYQKVVAQFGKNLKGQASMLDTIWQLPFAWPPVVPTEVSAVDQDMIKSVVKDSYFDAQYVVTIEDEGSKIDLNDLASPSKALRDSTRAQLVNIFKNRHENDPEWSVEHKDLKYEEIIDNIADWVDDDRLSKTGAEESSLYDRLGSETPFPPNRAFRSIGEVRMVAGVTDEFYDMIAPQVTIYGMKAINPNYATKDVLMSIHPKITTKVADEIIKRRDNANEGGPFKEGNEDADFYGFLQQQGVSVDKGERVPLTYDFVANFRIKSTGTFGNASKSIEAVVYDTNAATAKVAAAVKKEKPEDQTKKPPDTTTPGAPTTSGKTENQQSTPQPAKGRPRIVYWYEH